MIGETGGSMETDAALWIKEPVAGITAGERESK